MSNFINDTTTDQHHHEHEHGTAGSEVDPDNGHNSNSESTNDAEKHNQHHKGKESEDMNRTAQNTSAPIFTGFALSVMLILFSAFNAQGFATVFDGEFPDKACATFNYNVDNSGCKDASVGFNQNEDFDAEGRIFARAGEKDFIGLRDAGFINVDKINFARFNADRITNANARFGNRNGRSYFRFVNTDCPLFCDKQTFGFGNGFPNVTNEFQIPGVVFTPFDGFNSAGFSGKSLAA